MSTEDYLASLMAFKRRMWLKLRERLNRPKAMFYGADFASQRDYAVGCLITPEGRHIPLSTEEATKLWNEIKAGEGGYERVSAQEIEFIDPLAKKEDGYKLSRNQNQILIEFQRILKAMDEANSKPVGTNPTVTNWGEVPKRPGS